MTFILISLTLEFTDMDIPHSIAILERLKTVLLVGLLQLVDLNVHRVGMLFRKHSQNQIPVLPHLKHSQDQKMPYC